MENKKMKKAEQEFNSANTSINSSKVPAVFGKVSWSIGTRNLDWGGGKFDTAAEYMAGIGCQNSVYDPYNRTPEHNEAVLAAAPYDTATVSNVLNVIKEPEIRKEIVKKALDYLSESGIMYITIYQGNKSGIGRQTKEGCWQNNQTLAFYAEELKEFRPTTKRGMIIIKKETKED